MSVIRISRRQLMGGVAAIGATAGLWPGRSAFAKDIVVGFIYVGSRDDYGYNQAHAQGAAALKIGRRGQGRRGGECRRDRRRREDHGVDDQSRRRER